MGKDYFMALKLDMSYDRVEWLFLERVLCRVGFSQSNVDLIMMCVHTVHYSVLLNGEPLDPIQLERGIWQGSSFALFVPNLHEGF